MHTFSKIAVITNYSLRYSPYVLFYATLLDNKGIDYIILNKENSDFSEDNHHHVFKQTKEMFAQNIFKRTIDWYLFIHKELKNNHIEKMIITPTRTAMVLLPILIFKKGRFIFDIRDYTNERSFFYRVIERILLSWSGLVVISSAGFYSWLPKTNTKVVTIHNMPIKAKFLKFCEHKEKKRIKIAFIGMLGYLDINKKLIDLFNNDETYELIYSGAGDSRIQEYAKKINAKNVTFTGPFRNEEKVMLYENIDMINAIYGCDSPIVTTALPNKLYDAIIYRKPIIASKNTFLGELVVQNHIGIAIDIKTDDIKNELDNFWRSFDSDVFVANCDKLYKVVMKEQLYTINTIINWCEK